MKTTNCRRLVVVLYRFAFVSGYCASSGGESVVEVAGMAEEDAFIVAGTTWRVIRANAACSHPARGIGA